MNVTHAELTKVAVNPEQYPQEGWPEFALAGRSNVGKSSFINRMMNRKSLARTSSKPGKTQTLNFYGINEKLFFVDVPGYGYAKVSKKEREAWGRMIEHYFEKREQLKAAIHIVDIRHEPTKDDQLMYDWFKYYDIPVIIVATKCDKIAKGKWQKHIKMVKDGLKVQQPDRIYAFSSETGYGKEDVWRAISEFINEK